MPYSSQKPLPFVGREQELAQFRAMLAGGDRWLMWVVGPAGQGKSKLLEAILAECDQRQDVVTSGLFDFFTDGLRTRQGVLEELAGRFNVSGEEFADARQSYQEATARGEAQGQAFHLDRMEKELVRVLGERQAEGRRLVIAADTVELVSGLGVGDWFFGEFLPRLRPGVTVVAGGRSVPERVAEALAEQSERVDLTTADRLLEREDIQGYLRQTVPGYDDLFDATLREHIYEITAGPGQGLMLALVADALSGNSIVTLPPDVEIGDWLRGLDAEALRRRLVDGPLLAGDDPMGKAALILTHLYHGVDAGLLNHLSTVRPNIASMAEMSFTALVTGAERLPYLKLHRSSEKEETQAQIVRVHDYFADRARANAWVHLDPDLSTRSALSWAVVDYLEQQINSEAAGVSPRLDRLREQWLYHLFFADRERAYGELWEMLDQAWHHLRYDYMDVLLERARMINAIFATVGLYDAVLERLEKAARAWMDLEIAKAGEAEGLADEILANDAGVRRLRLTALVAKGTVLGRRGQVDEGIAMLNEAFEGYEQLLVMAEAAEAGDETAQAELRTEHSLATVHGMRPERYLIRNTIGYQERNRGRYPQALEAYRHTYRLSRDEGDAEWQASAATRLGDVARYMGDVPRAFDWVKRALALIRKEGLKEDEGFTLVALGRLQRDRGLLAEAENSFQDARAIWEPLAAERYLAETELELGWVDVLLGQYEDSKQHFEAAEKTILERYTQLTPSLREKQGKGLLREAQDASTGAAREELLSQAEALLNHGLEAGREKKRELFVALCLVALCRIAEIRGEYERIPLWEQELREYAKEKYLFGPAFADLEQVLGDVALRQAGVGQSDFDPTLFDKATDHYLQMYVHLAREAPFLYRERRDFLREWLPALPDELRQRAGRRLIAGWQRQGDLAKEHPGIIQTIQIECDIEPE